MEDDCALAGGRAWADTLLDSPDPNALRNLLGGRSAGICMPDFLAGHECVALTERVNELEFGDYLNVTPAIGRVGTTVFEYDAIGKQEYFIEAKAANARIAKIVDGLFHPMQRVMEWLKALHPNGDVRIAEEDGYGPYFAGLLRRIEMGTQIHIDYAPVEQPGWEIARVRSQLAFNLYLDVPIDKPGVVKTWKRGWKSADVEFKLPDSYGYRPSIVDGVESAEIIPSVGMLMLINTRNFHQVFPANGVRLTLSAAVGLTDDGDLVLWS